MESDDASKQYAAPQWTGTSNTSGLGDQNYAVAYTKNSTPKVAATFKIPTGLGVTSVQIKASGPDSFGIPATTETVGSGGTITLPATSSTSALPNSIKYYNKADSTAFTINWQISLNGGSTWAQISTTHTVYVTLATPVTALRQESLFEIGCREANGMQGDPNNLQDRISITNAIWTDFSNLNVKRVDGTPLTYYSDYNTPAQHTADLLSTSDGQCGAWAELFLDIREAQGLGGNPNLVQIFPPPQGGADGFIVDNWNFAANGSSNNANFPFLNVPANPLTLKNGYAWNYSEVTQGQGIPGENNKTPASLFAGHVMAEVDNKYFDPSYGKTPQNQGDIHNLMAGFFLTGQALVNGVQKQVYLFNQDPAPHLAFRFVLFPY